MIALFPLLVGLAVTRTAGAVPYNTFDGPGFPACHNVARVYEPTTVDEIVSIVKDASASGTPVRASGKGHMWYDTMCSDDARTVIIRTERVNRIFNLQMGPNGRGSVMLETGATFSQVAEWLHERGASLGFTLVNWNISMAGAIAMGAHRSSLGEDSQVSSAALAFDIVNGKGELVHLEKDQSNTTWLAATTSLGLLGVIARVKFEVLADFKVFANQETLDEEVVFNSDLHAVISPFVTANYWWWPGLKKFHLRTYNPVPITQSGEAFQNTFSVTETEANIAKEVLNSGQNASLPNFVMESLFFTLWSAPNFRNKKTDLPLISWPVHGWAYDVLIGGLYRDQKPEWEFDLHGYTFEIAVPVTMGTQVLRRVRQLIDEAAAFPSLKPVTSTYRSGINIKFGRPFDSLLGQTTERTGTVKGDWSKGAMMFDFPTFRPNTGDHSRFNEQFYHNLATKLINEFPARPHWTKCTRDVLRQSVKNLDSKSLAEFKKVRETFDPKGTFKSVVGEIIGVV